MVLFSRLGLTAQLTNCQTTGFCQLGLNTLGNNFFFLRKQVYKFRNVIHDTREPGNAHGRNMICRVIGSNGLGCRFKSFSVWDTLLPFVVSAVQDGGYAYLQEKMDIDTLCHDRMRSYVPGNTSNSQSSGTSLDVSEENSG